MCLRIGRVCLTSISFQSHHRFTVYSKIVEFYKQRGVVYKSLHSLVSKIQGNFCLLVCWVVTIRMLRAVWHSRVSTLITVPVVLSQLATLPSFFFVDIGGPSLPVYTSSSVYTNSNYTFFLACITSCICIITKVK